MRSLAEISFRLGQECANARLLWMPPAEPPPGWGGAIQRGIQGLPDPRLVASQLRGSSYAGSIEQLAEEIVAHRFRLLGLPLTDLGPRIAWRKDFVHGKETGLEYFRRISYLDFQRVGDHKVIWELNRHQHLVVLAQAFLLTGRREYRDEIPRQLESWMEANPFERGINWCSALEAAMRALSWIWVLHLVGTEEFAESFCTRWMTSLYQHGLFLENNLSIYFSPNTHLLGEAVVLHALGTTMPAFPRSARWRETGARIVREQMRRQVRKDGSHFEQSTYYHLYALDFFLLHSVIAKDSPDWYLEKLRSMAEVLNALVSSEGILPFLGDEDGGRVFHPYGDRRHFAGATLTTCALALGRNEWLRKDSRMEEQAAWWLGRTDVPQIPVHNPESRWFPDAGLAILRSETTHVIVDAGPFGGGTAGHSHADTLSIVVFHKGEEVLIDPGTYTYVADPPARERFRSTAAHNTISIQGIEQATPRGPFRWQDPPVVELQHWSTNEREDILVAYCRYGGYTHRRSVVFDKPDTLLIVDHVDGPATELLVEQRWLSPAGSGTSFVATMPPAALEVSERSAAFGSKQPAHAWVVRKKGDLPAIFVALMIFDDVPKLRAVGGSREETRVEYGESLAVVAHFPVDGAPRLDRLASS